MKQIKVVTAKRTRKPFLTENKRYVLIGESENRFRVKNDAGKLGWEHKKDFHSGKDIFRYGWDFNLGIFPGVVIPTAGITYDKTDRELTFGIVGLCFHFIVQYTRKPKL